jgi:hypothetical protein
LLQLYGKPLPQRAVKHGVARFVVKVGEHNRIFVCKFGRAMQVEIAANCKYQDG